MKQPPTTAGNILTTDRTIGQVATRKTLTQHNLEELAARQVSIGARNGVVFARNSEGEGKIAARQRILDIFHPDRWPGRLHMLTMPGVQWRFERKLLGLREDAWLRKPRPCRTYFTACESNRAIYHAALCQMPGLHTAHAMLKPVRRERAIFAEIAMKTTYASFFFANMDDLIQSDCWTEPWDAAWLDYTGPLTPERLRLIQQFYQRHVRRILIITALKTRYERSTVTAIEKAGGYFQWLRHHLDGEVLHLIEYDDTSAMAQLAIQKIHSPLV
jgi:hypothetical protein